MEKKNRIRNFLTLLGINRVVDIFQSWRNFFIFTTPTPYTRQTRKVPLYTRFDDDARGNSCKHSIAFTPPQWHPGRNRPNPFHLDPFRLPVSSSPDYRWQERREKESVICVRPMYIRACVFVWEFSHIFLLRFLQNINISPTRLIIKCFIKLYWPNNIDSRWTLITY